MAYSGKCSMSENVCFWCVKCATDDCWVWLIYGTSQVFCFLCRTIVLAIIQSGAFYSPTIIVELPLSLLLYQFCFKYFGFLLIYIYIQLLYLFNGKIIYFYKVSFFILFTIFLLKSSLSVSIDEIDCPYDLGTGKVFLWKITI